MQRDPDSDHGPEVEILRNQVVTQARELAVLRWEIASLLRQRPVLQTARGVKSFLRQHVPGLVGHAVKLKRLAAASVASVKRRPHSAKQRSLIAQGQYPAPVLIADEGPFAERLAAMLPAADVTVVSGGGGLAKMLPVAAEDDATLRLPAKGSLGEWMIDGGRLHQFGTIVVAAGDGISLALLRGRLTERQVLVLTEGTGTMHPIGQELGQPAQRHDSAAIYTRLPAGWLDPLDEDLRPNPAIVSVRSWPKISVVMVSFNQAIFLEEGLRSILEQGYPNLEFLVVDGHSTDGSVEILERYRHRLDFLLIEPDNGQSDGLNKGFARATGDIVTWVNSDDLLEPGALFRVAQEFLDHRVDMVVGGCRQIGLHEARSFAITTPSFRWNCRCSFPSACCSISTASG